MIITKQKLQKFKNNSSDFLEEMKIKTEELSSVKGGHHFKVSANGNISSQKIDSQFI